MTRSPVNSAASIVVKYALDELLKGAELDELFNEKKRTLSELFDGPSKIHIIDAEIEI